MADGDWLALPSQTIALPVCREARLHVRRGWNHCSASDGNTVLLFGVEEMNVTIGIGGGNFLMATLFQSIPSCSFSMQPMTMFNPRQCPTLLIQLWAAHPKGKSEGVCTSPVVPLSCAAPRALKTPDRYGSGPSNGLSGGDFTSPALCGYFHAPIPHSGKH